MLKTVEMIVDFSRNPCTPPLTIMDRTVAAVESFRLLGTTINNSSTLHLYIGHVHIHTFLYSFILITVVIYNLLSILFIVGVFIILIICCLHYVCTSEL